MEGSRWAIHAPETQTASLAQQQEETAQYSFPKPPQAVVAHPLAPVPPQPIVSSVDGSLDEFAQTRPPDDLFADDFEPIPEPDPVSTTHSTGKQVSPVRNHRGERGGDSRRGGASDRNTVLPVQSTSEANTSDDKSGSINVANKKEAVKGDRSGTGGIKKAKLTEEELTAKMEAMKVKNQSLEAAHARAEADETYFKEREAHAQEKRRQERVNRQNMMGERERNRQRKLNALSGREWDAQKDEESSFTESPRTQFRRGAYGGVAPDIPYKDDKGTYNDPIDASRGNFQGRGVNRGRGRARGRGRGREGIEPSHASQTNQTPKHQQALPGAEDFPALPKSAPRIYPAQNSSPKPEINTDLETETLPPDKGASWAEEMEDQPAMA